MGNGTLRDRLTSGYATSVSETSCSSGTCAPISLVAHVQELLTIGPNCNNPVVSTASPTSDIWYNYGTTLTVSCNGVWGRSGGTGTRATSWSWDGGTASNVATTGSLVSSSRAMNSHHAFAVNKVAQYQLTLDSGAARATALVTAPPITGDNYWYDTGTIITYQGNGVFGRANGFGNRSASWYLDSGSSTTLSTSSTFTVSITMSAPHALHVVIRPQWQVSLDAISVGFLRSITPPTVAGDKYWYDGGTSVTIILNGTGNRVGGIGSRLASYAVNSGTPIPTATTGTVTVFNSIPMNSREVITSVSVIQYQFVLDSGSNLALSSITSPSIPGDKYWYDSGTQVTYVGTGVFARTSGTGSRVASWWVDSGTHTTISTVGTFSATASMSTPHTLHAQIMTQYAIILTGTFGISSATSPTISGDNYWYDGGTVVSIALQGEFGRASGTGWRTVSFSINGGPMIGTGGGGTVSVLTSLTLTSPQTILVVAIMQYQVTFDPTVTTALNSITAPTVAGDNYWYDSGSAVTLTVHGVWGRTATTGYRLSSFSVDGSGTTPVASSGTVTILNLAAISGPHSITSTAVVQYLLTVTGGSGRAYSVPPPIPGDTGWFDSGTTIRVSTNGIYDTSNGIRQRIAAWSVDNGQNNPTTVMPVVNTSAITMDGPHFVSFSSVTQFLVTIVVKDSGGSITLAPDSILLSVNGGTQTVTSGAVWVDSASVVSVDVIMWHGVNVVPAQATSYGVSSPLTIPINAKVYDATIIAQDPFGLPIGGADVKATLANGTTVHTTTGGDGTVKLRMIPLGTYDATVSAFGLSSMSSGNASIRGTTVTHLLLSWTLILIVIVAVLLALVGIVLVLRRR